MIRFSIPLLTLAAAVALWHTAPAEAATCGDSGNACATPNGTYNVALPERPETADRPAFIFLHGLGGSGDKVVKNKSFVRNITEQGYMLIAPTGMRRGNGPTNWSVKDGSPPMRDEEAFLLEVISDAAERFSLDRERVILSGFSRGGSMVWDLACSAPQHFAAFAPGGGGFWRPMAEECVAPVRLFHVHGWKDRTVPLEGRKIPGRTIHQGNLFAGIQTFGAANRCALERPLDAVVEGSLWIKTWVRCAEGSSLKFALHAGGHNLPKGWAKTIVDWFEQTPPVN